MEKRVILLVLDGVGIGCCPDSYLYGDQKSHTLANIAAQVGGLHMPCLQNLGLGNIEPLTGLDPVAEPAAAFGKMQEKSPGKDTTTGHWEMMGIVLTNPFPTYPKGFPRVVLNEFEERIGRKTLGNKAASGTVIIEELGEQHIKTGYPIVYTSADSVFQIAAHEEVVPVAELYRFCQIAREILQGEHGVGRVIARPFSGSPGNFYRTARRHDFSLPPPYNLLQVLAKAGKKTVGIGKIYDIFAADSIHESYPTSNNQEGLTKTTEALRRGGFDFLFINLLDFDQNYGHRNDVYGFARALEDFDKALPELLQGLQPHDLLIITADHGCDPTQLHSTDHSREYVPLLAFSPSCSPGVSLGRRDSFSDIGKTISEFFDIEAESLPGNSFYSQCRMEMEG